MQGLEYLQRELINKGFCEDISQIAAAITQVHNKNANQWGYSISDLPIFIKSPSPNSVPTIDEKKSIIYLSVSIDEKKHNDKNTNEISDLISSSNFSILIKGIKKSTSEEYYTGWHLDNDFKRQDSEKGVYYIHPQHHISFGGSKLKELVSNTGNYLLLTSPRLPHPPMDIFLALDFVLQHFVLYDDHKELTQSSSYCDLLKSSQMRLWRPYYTAIAKKWCPGCGLNVLNEKDCFKYLPQLGTN